MSSYTGRTSGLASLYSISPNVDIFCSGEYSSTHFNRNALRGENRYAVKSCRLISTLFLPLLNGSEIPAKRPTVKIRLLSHGSIFALLMAISGTAFVFPAGWQTIHNDLTPAQLPSA